MQEDPYQNFAGVSSIFKETLRDLSGEIITKLLELCEEPHGVRQEEVYRIIKARLKTINVVNHQDIRYISTFGLNEFQRGKESVMTKVFPGQADLVGDISVIEQEQFPTRGIFATRLQILALKPSPGKQLPL